MDPITSGILAAAGYDILKGTYSWLTGESVSNSVDAAARRTAEGYEYISTDHFHVLLESDAVEDRVEEFKGTGVPIPPEWLGAELARIVEQDLEVDPTAVAEDFLLNFERELSDHPDLWRRLRTVYDQEISEKLSDVDDDISDVDENLSEVSETLDELHEEVIRLRQERETVDPVEEAQRVFEENGFDWLHDEDFEDGRTDEESCWRRPFTFTEIADGYAVERERIRGDRPSVTDELVEQVAGGEMRVVKGLPGSGKTTICKSVAHRWHEKDDTGPVVYRGSGDVTHPVEHGPELEAAIETAKEDGPVLLVVTDAARRRTVEFFKTIREVRGDSDVSVLLDARSTEWEEFGEVLREHSAVELGSDVGKEIQELWAGEIDPYEVPPLDEREVARVVEKFEAVTGKNVQQEAADILDRIRIQEASDGEAVQTGSQSGAWPSPMLLLTYHLPVGDVEIDPSGEKSALRTHVEEVYAVITGAENPDLGDGLDLEDGEELLERLGCLANVLNAAEVGMPRELVHALGTSEDEHDAIKDLLEELEGLLHFGLDDDDTYWSHHQLWSMLYLELVLEDLGEVDARNLFEESVNALFEFVDDEDRRETYQGWLGRSVTLLHLFEEASGAMASGIVSAVFNIGEQCPKLTPLYGTTSYSGLKIPDLCSTEVRVQCSFQRSRMYRVLGNMELAMEELESFREKADEESLTSDWIDGQISNAQGIIAGMKGNFNVAKENLEQSLKIRREVGDRAGEAESLKNLGSVALERGYYERASEYYEWSLEIEREVENRAGEAKSLNGLGLVARSRDHYERAKEYHTRSLDISHQVRNRTGEAKSLNNLGSVALEQGNYEQAREHYQQSLEKAREVGDRASEATSLGNLGSVALEEGNHEQAREYHEKSLEIERKMGNNVGVAECLGNIGLVAQEQCDFGSAKELFKQSAYIFRETGTIDRFLKTVNNLVMVAIRTDDPKSGIEHAESALSVIENADLPGLESQRQNFENHLDRLDSLRGNVEDRYVEALENIIVKEPKIAYHFFRHVWESRDEAGENLRKVTLKAGVGLAALIEISDGYQESDQDIQPIIKTVAKERSQLPDIVRTVFEYLAGDPVDTSPRELLKAIAPELMTTDDVALKELDPEDLENVAFATLLGTLQNEAVDPN